MIQLAGIEMTNTPKLIVAVSGGVDSVVLLDILSQHGSSPQLIIAHFDHGIRDDSGEDEAFVRTLAQKYGHQYVSKRVELGLGTSENAARAARYEFLNEVSTQHNAAVVTAHHLDDLVETIAINLTRGTGWRGLSGFSAHIHRPLMHMTKKELLQYAQANGLVWREDSTNASDAYLRNRLRLKTSQLDDDDKRQLHALHAAQKELRKTIRQEVLALVGEGPLYSRYLFTQVPQKVATECLRVITRAQLTRPQMEKLLHAVKTAKAGSRFEVGAGITAQFSTRNFRL